MALLDDGMTVGADGATSGATGVSGTRAGGMRAVGATVTANAVATMGAVEDAGVALAVVVTGVCGATGDVSTGAGGAGTSTATAAMVTTADAGADLTTGTVNHEEKTNKTQATISLPSPTGNLAKELHKTPIDNQRLLSVQIHTFLLQESPDLTQINDAENSPVVGIINIPKSSTIWVLHSFGVSNNPIGVSSSVSGNILSISGDGSSSKPSQSIVLPR